VKVLITGGAGFIGCHLSRRLIEQGHEVTVVDMLHPYYSIERKRKQLHFVEEAGAFSFFSFNLLDEAKTRQLFEETNPECVIHLAAIPGVMPSLEQPLEYVDYDVKATINVLKSAGETGVKRVVFASSSSVYGNAHAGPVKEEMATGQVISPYAAAKYSAESFCHAYQHLYGFQLTILRFFTVYGPWGRPDMAMAKFIQAAVKEEPILLYGKKTTRDYTYIGDIIDGIEASVLHEHESETFNLGSSHPVAIERFVEILSSSFPGLKSIQKEKRAGDVVHTWADVSKANQLLGYKPQVTIEEGIERTIHWFKTYEAD
jgi:UDP-glucuronate 4-epimerase